MNRLAYFLIAILILLGFSSCRKEPQPNITALRYYVVNCSPPYQVGFYYEQDPETISEEGQECTWELPDGSTQINCGEVFYTIAAPGSYRVKLTIANEDKTASKELRVEIAASYPVTSAFSIENDDIYQECNAAFYNNSEHATDFKWYFGDGDSSIEVAPVHHYDAPGAYTVQLVSNCAGQSSTSTGTINVYANPGRANINSLYLNLPVANLDGDTDDRDYRPDYYWKIFSDNNLVFTTPTFEDVGEFPQTWFLPGISVFVSGTHTIRFELYDYDYDNADDYIGYYFFTSGFLKDNCFPTGVQLTDDLYVNLSYQ